MVRADAAHFEAVAAACEALRAAGLEAVPHAPASRFDDDAHAGRVLDELSAAGATSALVVAGNDFDGSAPDVDAVAALARKRGFRCLFAGFPEGHPHESSGGARLAAKLAPAGAGVVTQFVRDPAVLGEWLDGAPAAETVFVGVPGPATRRRLAQMAALCGVGPSVYVDAYDVDDDDDDGDDALLAPAADVGALADYLGSSEGNVRLHVYPFGGLDAALVFLDALASKGILWEPGGFGAGG
ncbi:phosphorelay sensor kinase [Aureococcus anophagefferens]|nr:phosphorelay sensor kinase [Aureococcus anophagefferens]